MKNNIQALLMAFTLLTRLPLTRLLPAEWSAVHYQRAVYYYPLVGLVIALLVCAFAALSASLVDTLLHAALVLCAWVFLTGGLHLGALADSVDAYFAAHKNPQKALLVFQDPTAGPMGVTALVLVLLLKFTALLSLQNNLLLAVCCACVGARAAVLWMMNATAYAPQPDEEGKISQPHHPRVTIAAYSVIAVCTAGLFYVMPWLLAVNVTTWVLLATWYWRKLWLDLIYGFTGNCLGALIEIIETLILIICVVGLT